MSKAFRLLVFLLKIHRLVPAAAPTLLSDATTVVADADESLFPHDDRLSTLLLLVEWSARESGGLSSVVGKSGDCGRVQLLFAPARDGHSCDELSKPGTLDLELALRWMIKMRDFCGGNVRKGLSAYARGSCTSKEGLEIADSRMAEIQKALSSSPKFSGKPEDCPSMSF
jgi:hypothetical protein